MSEEISNPNSNRQQAALQVVIELIRKDRLATAEQVIAAYDKLEQHFKEKKQG
ncbi:MAG: hypothetical protein RSD49_22050 [Hafnia sp.]